MQLESELKQDADSAPGVKKLMAAVLLQAVEDLAEISAGERHRCGRDQTTAVEFLSNRMPSAWGLRAVTIAGLLGFDARTWNKYCAAQIAAFQARCAAKRPRARRAK